MSSTKNITIYSTPDCAYCYTVKDFIKSQGFAYKEIDIYEDEEGRKKMVELSNQESVPVTVIGKEVIVGWEKNKLLDALNG